MSTRKKIVPLLTLFAAGTLAATVIEEDFKQYPDFDPAHRNWEFRGVGGEVRDGGYRFNGTGIQQKVEPDVHPALTMGQLRDYPAGTKLAIEAEFELGRKGFSFLDKEGKRVRRIGVVILDRQFARGRRDAMNIPTILLTLDLDATGKPSVFFGYTGTPKLSPQKKVYESAPWKPAGEYLFSLTFADNTATGIIKDAAGKVIYRGELRDPGFAKLFPHAHPGFANQRMEGALKRFRADNLDSFTAPAKLSPIPMPEVWTVVLDPEKNAKGALRQAKPDAQGKINVSAIAGGHRHKRLARLECELEVPATGKYAAQARGDWYWKLLVNGNSVANFSLRGNGMNDHVLELPLNAGKNRITVELGSGSDGWNFRLAPPEAEALKAKEAALHLYGADRIRWNLDRIFDDLNNLRRWRIEIPKLEQELLAMRRDLPAGLTNRDAEKFDPALDRFYLGIYNGRRLLRLRELRKELAGLSSLEENRNSDIAATLRKLDALDAGLLAAVSSENASTVETLAAEAQQLIDEGLNRCNGFREGVTLGRNFGRFGWVTGDKVAAYSSGDGLLANQVLANGALLRQYVTGEDGKTPWRMLFRFFGNRDAAKSAELAALPVSGENREVEFGYDPSSFYSGRTPQSVKVHETNWIHKRFSYAGGFTADMNLLTPALLLESGFHSLELSDPVTSAFTHFGYRNAKGEVVSQPLRDGVLYDRKRDGELGRNWVLFWSGDNREIDLAHHRGSIPVQVIFQRRPEKIERKNGRTVIQFARNGAVWLNTPFGARIQPAGNWRGFLPPSAAGRCDVHAQTALAWPVELREYFRPAGNGRVEIVNVAAFRKFTDNDWKLEPLEFVPLPPVLTLMTGRGFDAELPAQTVDLGYPTIYGPLHGVFASQLRYTLPVTEAPRTAFPQNPEANPDDAQQLITKTISQIDGIRFRLFCENIARNWHSLCPAIDRPAKAWSWLPEEFRDYMRGLYRARIPFLSSYRDYRFWRSLCEPYSGAKYFYSFSISTKNPGDVGVFGDRGYGVGNHLLMLDLVSSFGGEYDALKAIWRDPAPLAPPDAIRDGRTVTVDKMQGYLTSVHDWAWMEAGSNDSGDNGPVVDCGQSVFGGVAALYRMAQNLGSDTERARAAYHLAKSQLSQIGRPAFRDYGRESGTLGPDNINVGFREFITPRSYADSPMIGKTPRNEYDGSLDSLFCYANQDWFDVYYPYAKYVWNDLRYYEKQRALYWPNRDRGRSDMMGHLYSRLMFLMLNGTSQSEAVEMLHRWVDGSVFYLRDGALREILPFALTGGCPLVLHEWYPLAAPEFHFTPSKKLAELRFRNVSENFAFTASSATEPAAIRLNGEPLPRENWSYQPENRALRVQLPAGNTVAVELEYSEIQPDRLQLMPIPPAPATTPAAPGIEPEKFTPAARVKHTAKTARPATKPAAKPVAKEQQLYQSDFSGEAVPGAKMAGKWYFNTWAKTPLPASGGLTGDYPAEGIPARALEVTAVERNYAGRSSPRIQLPEKFSALVLRGEITYGKNFANNRVVTFFWTGKSAHFFQIPAGKPGSTRTFQFVLPAEKMPQGTTTVNLQVACQLDPKSQAKPAGSVYFRNITLSAR